MASDLTTLAKNGFPTLAEVCATPDKFLGTLDIAALNLMCAGGLANADNLDIAKYLEWLDEAASQVDFQVRGHLKGFQDSPETYRNSPGVFCCEYLLRTLQELFGVRYNPARVNDPSFQDPKCFNPDFSDSRDLFIHGIIDGQGGTCASMPVLYVAVGRRLGYPLKLVQSRGHLFFRWDAEERFNVEGTGHGISFNADEFYETWPEPWPEFDHLGGWYLKSLSPAGELADFLATRGACLAHIGRIDDAIEAYRWACGVTPHDARYWCQLENLRIRRGEIRRSQRNVIESLALGHEQQKWHKQRISELMQLDAPHNDYCTCFHCQKARQASQKTLPGHLPGCPCSGCRQHPMPNPFSPW